ncbi:hypothetical protein EW145_g8038, partial [Phellinidium pouzarii]
LVAPAPAADDGDGDDAYAFAEAGAKRGRRREARARKREARGLTEGKETKRERGERLRSAQTVLVASLEEDAVRSGRGESLMYE